MMYPSPLSDFCIIFQTNHLPDAHFFKILKTKEIICKVGMVGTAVRLMREIYALTDMFAKGYIRFGACEEADPWTTGPQFVRSTAQSHAVSPNLKLPRAAILQCVAAILAGALEESEYRAKLAAAGFVDVDLEPTRAYDIEDARLFLTEAGISVDEIAPQVEGKFLSALIRATKPSAPCCAPGCCP